MSLSPLLNAVVISFNEQTLFSCPTDGGQCSEVDKNAVPRARVGSLPY